MSKLILIEKNGQRIEVHPETLGSHLKVGWWVVPVEQEPEKEPEPEQESESESKPKNRTTRSRKK